jgi:hypothetical protein
VNNPLDVKKNCKYDIDFVYHLSHLFSVSVSLDFPCTTHAFFPKCLFNHCQGLHHTFCEIHTEFGDVPLSDPSRNQLRPDTEKRKQKNQHIHPVA